MRSSMKELEKIKMPQDMRQRIVKTCETREEKESMKNVTKLFRKPMAAAALICCIGMAGVGALAAGGYFRDVTDWSGAVVGTTYEQATEEVELTVLEVADVLTVQLEVVDKDAAPFCYLEELGIEGFQLLDSAENVLLEGKVDAVPLENGTAVLSVPLENVAGGTYKLSVSALCGLKKADQPLSIYGRWSVEFVK